MIFRWLSFWFDIVHFQCIYFVTFWYYLSLELKDFFLHSFNFLNWFSIVISLNFQLTHQLFNKCLEFGLDFIIKNCSFWCFHTRYTFHWFYIIHFAFKTVDLIEKIRVLRLKIHVSFIEIGFLFENSIPILFDTIYNFSQMLNFLILLQTDRNLSFPITIEFLPILVDLFFKPVDNFANIFSIKSILLRFFQFLWKLIDSRSQLLTGIEVFLTLPL